VHTHTAEGSFTLIVGVIIRRGMIVPKRPPRRDSCRACLSGWPGVRGIKWGIIWVKC
jgi:hypothetical protein